ncbi:uncharacterized protein LOC144240330 [Crocuta crocuta]
MAQGSLELTVHKCGPIQRAAPTDVFTAWDLAENLAVTQNIGTLRQDRRKEILQVWEVYAQSQQGELCESSSAASALGAAFCLIAPPALRCSQDRPDPVWIRPFCSLAIGLRITRCCHGTSLCPVG